jgi:uncharacterized protein DUF2721
MPDPSTLSSVLAPGVALTSAVIYWANLQGRLDAISTRVRALNGELRGLVEGAPRALSVQRQVSMLNRRSQVLHAGVVLSVVTVVAFLGSTAVLFVALAAARQSDGLATVLFMTGLASFGVSLATTLWEMLWARRSLDEDIAGSPPAPRTK